MWSGSRRVFESGYGRRHPAGGLSLFVDLLVDLSDPVDYFGMLLEELPAVSGSGFELAEAVPDVSLIGS